MFEAFSTTILLLSGKLISFLASAIILLILLGFSVSFKSSWFAKVSLIGLGEVAI